MSMETHVVGAVEVERALLGLAADIPHLIASALNEEAELTMAQAKELCPVDTGALRASGHVQPPEIRGHEISSTLGFGGAASKYALSVHENPRAGKTAGWGTGGFVEGAEGESRWEGIQFRWIKGRVVPIGARRKHWATTGQWKYLEQPFLARAAGLAERIKAHVLGAG